MLSPPEVIDWDCKPIELSPELRSKPELCHMAKGWPERTNCPKGFGLELLAWPRWVRYQFNHPSGDIPGIHMDTWDMGYNNQQIWHGIASKCRIQVMAVYAKLGPGLHLGGGQPPLGADRLNHIFPDFMIFIGWSCRIVSLSVIWIHSYRLFIGWRKSAVQIFYAPDSLRSQVGLRWMHRRLTAAEFDEVMLGL